MYTISNSILNLSVSELGAEPKSLTIGSREWLVQHQNEDGTGFSPILFPLIGPLKNNEHQIDGKTYPMPMHGFAKNSIFQLKEKTENSMTLLFSSNEETMKMYPYAFQLAVTYTLEDHCFTTEYTIKNEDEKAMPFAIGSHIGFCLNTEKENYTLVFDHDLENQKGVALYNACDAFSFEGDKLNLKDLFFKTGCICVGNHKSESWRFVNNVDKSVIAYSSKDFPYLTLWSIPERPFICLESWSFRSCHFCDEQSIAEFPEVCTLEKGEQKTFRYTLTFRDPYNYEFEIK